MGRRFTERNESFTCVHCHTEVLPAGRTCRNHCPNCLYSVHLDNFPGDRAADCGGVLVPIEIIYRPNKNKGYQIVHRCERCGHESRNVTLLDDPIQPDSLDAILDLMKHSGGR